MTTNSVAPSELAYCLRRPYSTKLAARWAPSHSSSTVRAELVQQSWIGRTTWTTRPSCDSLQRRNEYVRALSIAP
jgi:hypothetical protein